jgi:ferredoxin
MSGRAAVDPEVCIGSGDCVRIAPAAFVIEEATGVSTPLPGAAATPIDVLVEAARNCPTNAIEVRDADGAVLVASAG